MLNEHFECASIIIKNISTINGPAKSMWILSQVAVVIPIDAGMFLEENDHWTDTLQTVALLHQTIDLSQVTTLNYELAP